MRASHAHPGTVDMILEDTNITRAGKRPIILAIQRLVDRSLIIVAFE